MGSVLGGVLVALGLLLALPVALSLVGVSGGAVALVGVLAASLVTGVAFARRSAIRLA